MTTSSANDRSATLCVFIVPLNRTSRGQLYEVRVGDAQGPVIVERALDPEHAACRALVAMGIGEGRLKVWSEGRTTPSMIIRSIEKAAGLSVREDSRKGPLLVPFKPRLQEDNGVALDASIGADDAPSAAEDEVEAAVTA